MSLNVIEVEGLSVTMQHVEVLSAVTFHIPHGEYVGIVGPTGPARRP
jgi:ABC-type Mn2+/Zn2+ transport system ATPase subunit